MLLRRASFRPVLSASNRLAVRCFSQSKVGSSIDEDSETNVKSSQTRGFMGLQADQIKTAGAISVGSVVLYGLSSLFYDVAATFMALTPASSLKYGFGFGMLSTGSAVATLWQFERIIYAKPELAFNAGLKLLQNDDNLNSLLGGKASFTAQDVKVYKSRGGSFGVVNSTMTWKAPRVEMQFSARNDTSTAHLNCLIISEQAFLGPPKIEFCGVDVLSDAQTKQTTKKRTRLVLKEVNADAEEVHFAIMDRMGVNLSEMSRS
jgi:hypothetical protein